MAVDDWRKEADIFPAPDDVQGYHLIVRTTYEQGNHQRITLVVGTEPGEDGEDEPAADA